ncbi:serine/threonine protein kinase [Antricoccus suffuscus]|uniref:non-specific serine/threonine protein kinase n=1 Tax=Antricoccus suffuscus TaxID=1629062 RepID=A0A2T1A4H5_9ACTN|nr:serine/threonine-protein kinase [Antricoccus suffuscus]PRZ43407.1 serine/threonine protein kinase [Antricoccus suffuscus]
MAYHAGDSFAGYTIEGVLGTGGMGAVYLAKHPRLPRRDALKLLSSALFSDATYRARFEREADIAAQLIHRNIVAVYDRGSYDDQLWISMQYVAGTDASKALRDGNGPMHADRAVHIVAEVAAGLDYAHRTGLLHRDVKPANILLAPAPDRSDPEEVLLADFGIAKSMHEGSSLTGAGNLLATLAYAAPEVIEGEKVDHRADIYSLGCVLFELLTGRVPFPTTSPFATMNAQLKDDPPRPSEKVFGVPKAMDAVIGKAMAKNPAERYQSCRELSNAAREALKVSDEPSLRASPLRADTDHEVVRNSAGVRPRPPYTLIVRQFASRGGPKLELGPVDTVTVSTAERGALETLVRAARFFDLPPRLPLERVIDNDVLIEITVQSGDLSRVVGFERQGARHPHELDSLIARIEQITSWHATAAAPATASSPTTRTSSTWSPVEIIPPIGSRRRPDSGSVRSPGPMPVGRLSSIPVSQHFADGHRAPARPRTAPQSAPLPLRRADPQSAPLPPPQPASANNDRKFIAAGIIILVVLVVVAILVIALK